MGRASVRTLLAFLATLAGVSGLWGQENRGWLGIEIADSGEARVVSVRESSPAERAGIRPGDVIVALNGVVLSREKKGNPFELLRVGEEAEIRVRRSDREVDLVVVPGAWADAFGEEPMVVVMPGRWDSVYVQMRLLHEGQLQLQMALRDAKVALAQTEGQRATSEEQRRLAVALRTQIDSMQRALAESYRVIRVHTDSLAARTLRVSPNEVVSVEVSPVRPSEMRTIAIYRDAVAGARFTELSGELADYFPGVTEGLLIVELVEGTPAAAAGLQEGDVVIAVNGEPVSSVGELRRLLAGAREAELSYVRKGKKKTSKIGSDG